MKSNQAKELTYVHIVEAFARIVTEHSNCGGRKPRGTYGPREPFHPCNRDELVRYLTYCWQVLVRCNVMGQGAWYADLMVESSHRMRFRAAGFHIMQSDGMITGSTTIIIHRKCLYSRVHP